MWARVASGAFEHPLPLSPSWLFAFRVSFEFCRFCCFLSILLVFAFLFFFRFVSSVMVFRCLFVLNRVEGLQCFDAVGWAAGRASGL